MRVILTAIFCACGFGVAAQGYDLDELFNLPTASTLQFDRNVTVEPSMRQIISENLRDAIYFGAFALHPSGAYGHSSEANSMVGAEASALRFCADVSFNDGQCQIAARLVPKGLSPENYPPISPAISDGIIEVDSLNELGYAAVAASGDGAWGSSLNGPDEEEAIKIALESCEGWRNSGDETPLTGFPCEIIVVMHSDVVLPLRE